MVQLKLDTTHVSEGTNSSRGLNQLS